MPKKITTIFQDLNRAFNGSWDSSGRVPRHSNTYDMTSATSNILYKTNDKADYEKTKLEMQQQAFLQNEWHRTNQSLAISSYAGLNNVKLMYRDADLMDAYPEIGCALTIMSEEATIAGDTGMIVNVSSKSERIKSVLEDLFVNRLNLQITSQMIIRAMCKYGNQFMLLDIEKGMGVKGWRQLPVAEVERIENGITNPYGGAQVIAGDGRDRDNSTKFVWTNSFGGAEAVPFMDWQVAHFRILDNSMYLPMGCSVLNSARRSWRMLSLMEDMMLIYRLERSMERRVYKIFVGAIDDEDVPAFVERIADNFKRTPIVDPMTGQLDLRKNILPVWKKTPIALTDGRTITIEDLANEYEAGKENYVYSVQDKTQDIVEGKVVWCGKTGCPEKLYKICFYNRTHMILAGEHEVMLINGKMKRADKLIPGEELMPFSSERKDNKHIPTNPREYCVIKEIETIEGDDVYCMTVEGDTKATKNDRHNFALYTFNEDGSINNNGGCFVSNCASDDIFIPVRDANAPTPIDTLAGAKNLEAIDDIKFMQNKMLTALRIPKQFLNFEEAAGDGKNLALMDIRFTRTINRIQQAFLMGLTKVASIHLWLLGFKDDMTNFSLSMNNPSTQAEQLAIDNTQKKISAVRDAVSDPGNGIPVMSLVRALKQIMHWSDKEIKENLEEIRLEKALAAELEKTAQIIKRTGLFDIVDRIYGEPGAEYQEEQGGGPGGLGNGPMGGGGGGLIGGGGFGEGLDSLGQPGGEEEGDIAGETGQEPTADMGAPEGPGGEAGPQQPMESKKFKGKKMLNESKVKAAKELNDKRVNYLFEKLLDNLEKKGSDEMVERTEIYDKAFMINEEFDKMIKHVDEFASKSETE